MEREDLKNALKKRKNFLFGVFVAIALFSALFVGYFLYIGLRDSFAAPLVILATFNSFLLLTLLYILLRQLVKGYLVWRREKEGAKIRTRLLTAFIFLGLIPSILLLLGAIIMVESAVASWFRLPVHTTNAAGQRLVDASLDILREKSFKRASGIARQMKAIPPDIQTSFVYHISDSEDFDSICLVDSSGKLLFSKPTNSITIDNFKIEKIFSDPGLKGYIILGQKSYVFSSARISNERAILIGYLLPENLLKEAKFIAENQKLYLQAKSERKVFKISMISSFLALTLAVIFAAVWIGTRLTREINRPLKMLLEGTAEVSKGNLDHRIEYSAKDEIGQVVSSFNKMVEDLLASKKEVEKSNQELREARDSAERRRNYIEVLVETLNVGIVSLGADGEIVNLNKKAREFLELSYKDPPQKAVTL
ncbi:MAG: HAMP domain-containing protein, partial [Acidobacteria bacterium]|nr:HAMP domain-containing protein [Acidobacteriota bacterium]